MVVDEEEVTMELYVWNCILGSDEWLQRRRRRRRRRSRADAPASPLSSLTSGPVIEGW